MGVNTIIPLGDPYSRSILDTAGSMTQHPANRQDRRHPELSLCQAQSRMRSQFERTLEFLHLSPFSKGDAALFAAGGLYRFVSHPL
jgi:hypothetical protein